MSDQIPEGQIQYHPFYCEENIWLLAQHPQLKQYKKRAVFISNPIGQCPLFAQRASTDGGYVVWDYHVVLLLEDDAHWIWDLDTLLNTPCLLQHWLRGTFPQVEQMPPQLWPLFRLVDSQDLLEHFCSDRRHMRDDNGDYVHPPPPWPPPTISGVEHNLEMFTTIDPSTERRANPGVLKTLEEMHQLAI